MLRPNLNRNWRELYLRTSRFAGVGAIVFAFSIFVPTASAANPERSSKIGDSERIELTHGFVRTRGSTLAQRKIARNYADKMVNSNARALAQCFARARVAAMQSEKTDLTRHRMTIQFTLDPRVGISDMQIVQGEFTRTVDSECVMLRLMFTEGSVPDLESTVTVFLPLRFDFRTKRSTHILPLGPGGIWHDDGCTAIVITKWPGDSLAAELFGYARNQSAGMERGRPVPERKYSLLVYTDT